MYAGDPVSWISFVEVFGGFLLLDCENEALARRERCLMREIERRNCAVRVSERVMEWLYNGDFGESLRIIGIVKPSLMECDDFDGMKVEHKRKRRESETMVEAMSDSFSYASEHHFSPFIGRDVELNAGIDIGEDFT